MGQHSKMLELLLLLLIFSPTVVNANDHQDSHPWFGTIVLVLSCVLLLITAAVAILIHHYYGDGCSGGIAMELHHPYPETAAVRGLDATVIASIPSLRFSDIKMHRLGQGELECPVCLYQFEDQETLRLLPDCFHVFHPDCIAPWLASHATCPVCRASLEHGQGSNISMSSILDRISGALDYHHPDNNHDDHFVVEIEGSSSIKVNQNGTLEGKCYSVERLRRCHSMGQLEMRGPYLSTMWPNDISPKSDYGANNCNANLNRLGCFATAPVSPNR